MNSSQMTVSLVAGISLLWGLLAPASLWWGLVTVCLIIWLKRQTIQQSFRALDLAVMGISVCEIVMYFCSTYKANSFTPVLVSITFALLWLLWRQKLTEPITQRVVIRLVAAIGGLSAMLTLIFFVFYHVRISDLGFDDLSQFRANYHPMGMLSNDWAGFMLAFLPFSVAACLTARRPQSWWWVGATTFEAVALMLSLSRGAILALLLFGVATFIVLLYFKAVQLKHLCWTTALFATVVILACIPVRSALQTTFAVTGSLSHVRSIEGRFARWNDALTLFERYPLTGVGAGNFALAATPLSNRRETIFTGRCTNSWLQLAAEKGFAGILMYVFFAALLIKITARLLRKRDPSNAVRVVFAVGFAVVCIREISFSTLWEMPSLLLLLLLMALMIDNSSYEKEKSRRLRAAIVGVVGLLLLLPFGVMQTRHNGALRHNRAFVRACKERDAAEALAEAQQAVNLWPDNALLQANVGLCLADSLPSEASQFFKAAITLQPLDAAFYAQLGMSLLWEADTSAAQLLLERAVQLSPNEAVYHLLCCMVGATHDSLAFRYHAVRALYAAPDVTDSRWFTTLGNDDSIAARTLAQQAAQMLADSLVRQATPQRKSRYAKLLLYLGQHNTAETLLHEVIQEMPNLNRAWLMLGDIAALRGDTAAADHYAKALSLDATDAYAQRRMGDLLIQRKQLSKAFGYYLTALQLTYHARSDHSLHSRALYRSYTRENDLLPSDLLQQIKPDVQPARIAEIIAQGFQQEGNARMAKRYRRFARGEIPFTTLSEK